MPLDTTALLARSVPHQRCVQRVGMAVEAAVTVCAVGIVPPVSIVPRDRRVPVLPHALRGTFVQQALVTSASTLVHQGMRVQKAHRSER